MTFQASLYAIVQALSVVNRAAQAVEDELEEYPSDESLSEHDTHRGELWDPLEGLRVLYGSLQQRASDYQASEPQQQVYGGIES